MTPEEPADAKPSAWSERNEADRKPHEYFGSLSHERTSHRREYERRDDATRRAAADELTRLTEELELY